MDVKLEQVEEWIVYHRYGAIQLALDAVAELERFPGFVAYRKWNPLDLIFGILDMFARLSKDL